MSHMLKNLILLGALMLCTQVAKANRSPAVIEKVKKQETYKAAKSEMKVFFLQCMDINMANAAKQGFPVQDPQVQAMFMNACSCFTHFAGKSYDLKTPLTEKQFLGVMQKCKN